MILGRGPAARVESWHSIGDGLRAEHLTDPSNQLISQVSTNMIKLKTLIFLDPFDPIVSQCGAVTSEVTIGPTIQSGFKCFEHLRVKY